MTNNVYNIGGYYFSLLDVSQPISLLPQSLYSVYLLLSIKIENGILRNASTQVSFVGPLLPVHSFTGMRRDQP